MTEAERLEKLNRVISLCRKSAFYGGRIADRELQTIGDLKTLPVTTRKDIQDHSPYGLLCVPREELYQYHETFGTTGEPASSWMCREDVEDYARRANEGGMHFHKQDVVLIRFPYAISTVAHLTHNAAQAKGACVIPASSRTVVTPYTRVVKLMRKLEVTVLAALPMQAELIAEAAQMMGYDPRKDFPALRLVYTAGEVMYPGRRKKIEDMWGVPVNDNYGMTEFGPAVVDCEYGVPHPLEDSFIFEILDRNLKNEVEPGQTGQLVVTTLSRKASPLIRYVTGDRARRLPVRCPCGRSVSMQIRGRARDVLKIQEKELDTWDLGEIVSYLPSCRFWAAGPVSGKLGLIVEEEEGYEPENKHLLNELQQRYGIEILVEAVPRGTLYDRNELLSVGVVGKPRYIYSEEEMKSKAYIQSTRSL